jgi:hypothetical protein
MQNEQSVINKENEIIVNLRNTILSNNINYTNTLSMINNFNNNLKK